MRLKRETYLEQIRPYYDSDIIKVITGVRRCGKSILLETIKDVDEPIVGIFRLVMKSNSDNYRESSIVDIMDGLSEMGVGIRIYEPTLVTSRFKSHPVVEDLNEFKGSCDLIVTNRMSHELDDVESIVFCRDVFQRD